MNCPCIHRFFRGGVVKIAHECGVPEFVELFREEESDRHGRYSCYGATVICEDVEKESLCRIGSVGHCADLSGFSYCLVIVVGVLGGDNFSGRGDFA